MKHDPVRADINAHLKRIDEDDQYELAIEGRAKEIKELILDGDYYHNGMRYGPADITVEINDDEHEALVMDVSQASLARSDDMFSENFRCAAYMVQQCVQRAAERLAQRFAKIEYEEQE